MVGLISVTLRDFQFIWVSLHANRVVWALPSVPGYEIVSWPIVQYGGIRDRLPGTRNKGYLGCDGGIGYVPETLWDMKGQIGTRIQANGVIEDMKGCRIYLPGDFQAMTQINRNDAVHRL